MFLASFLLTFGLLFAAIVAAAIKIVCFPKRANTFQPLVRGGAIGVLTAVAALAALGQAGVDLEGRLFGDLLQNAAALVSIGALVCTTRAALRERTLIMLTGAQSGSR